jgi:hypothetical protein
LEVCFGLDEHYSFDETSGVVVLFLGLDVNQQIAAAVTGISHINNTKIAAFIPPFPHVTVQ